MIHESPNFRVEADDQVATLWLDFRGQAVNRFTPEVLADLDDALNALAARPGLDVLLLRSAKPAGFAADFDPHALARLGSAAELTELARRGQEVLARLEGLSPGLVTLALVEGPCLGAGLELALACDYRAAVAGPATEFAFPGVHAGLAPFWGGTVRLPRRVGTARALEMLLTGRALSAGQARDWGLVDFIFPERQLKVGLRSLLDRLQDAPRRPPAGRRGGLRRLLAENPLGRALALRAAARRLADVPAEDRPAGHAIVAALRAGLGCAAEGMARERAALAELAPTPACRNGLGLRRQAEQPLKIYPGPVNPVPLPPGTVGVVGGGDLGAALACWLALRGRTVVLQEPGDQALTRAGARLERLLAAAVAAGRVTADAAEQAGRAVRRTVTWQGFEECGWVIEAVEEDLGVKRGVLHELEERCRARVPLVSAASTVRVESLQAELQRPGRVAGMHFLAPVEENPIVELVRAPATDPDTLA
ncbi:MAG TPA: 3-hydroxyacyl-CoA dehydrogenase NAD-binding domain-containing protein, partial [Gemmataceae bacterium]